MLTFFTSVTLTFNLVNPISIGTRWGRHNHVLTKTNQHVKYESSVIKSFQDNERKQFGLPTVVRTDRPTLAKQYTPLHRREGA